MAETLKDYLVGIKFETKGADQANQAVSELDGIIRELGNVLMQAAQAFQGVINQMQGGKGVIEDTSNSMHQGTESAGKMTDALRKANNEGKMHGLAQGKHRVAGLDNAMRKATNTLKRYAKMAVTYLIGSNVVNAFKRVMEFNEGLAASAKKLGKTIEQTRAYNLALQVMGKTAKEIEQDKSLKATFDNLQKIGTSLALPEAAAGIRNIGAVKDSLMELKMVGSYALQWIYYKVQEVAAGPLAETRKILGSIRDWFGGNIKNIAEGFGKAFGWVLQIINSVVIAIGKIVGWIDKLPPAIKIAGAVAIAVIMAVKSKTALITMIIGAILLLIDDFVTYMEGGDSLFGGFWGACIEWIEKIKPAIDAVISWIDGLIQKVAEIIGGIIDGFKSFWNTLEDNGTLLKLQGIFEDVFSVVQGVIDTAIRWFSNLFVGIEDGGERSKSAFSYMCDAIAGVIDIVATVIGWVTDLVTKILEIPGVMETINGLVDTATAIITGAWEIINGVIQAIIALLNGDLSGAWQAVSTAASGAWDLIMSTADGLCEGLITLFNSIKQFFSDLFAGLPAFASQAWEDIKSAFSGVAEWFSATFSEAWKAVEDIFGKVGEWAAGIWAGISEGIAKAAGWVQGAARDAGAWITQAGVDVGDFFKNGWYSIFGGPEEQEPIPVEVDTTQVEEAQDSVEAFKAAIETVIDNGKLNDWYTEQFSQIQEVVEKGAEAVKQVRDSIAKSMSSAASSVSRSVAAIKRALSSIPRNITTTVSVTTKQYQSVLSTIGNGQFTPAYALAGMSSVTNSNSSSTVNAPVTINVNGDNAKAVGKQVANDVSQVLRNAKSAIN